MKPRVLLRADGHSRMGLGHVMRCLALAEMLRSDFDLRFAIHQPSEALRQRILASGLPVLEVSDPVDALELAQIAIDDDVVVLDGYAFDHDFQRLLKLHCRRLVYIDDWCVKHPIADVIINHAGGLHPEEFEADLQTQLCLGPAYALVHPAFVSARRPAGKGILINLGGADPHNLTLRVVQTLLSAGSSEPLTVVLGAANPHGASFNQLAGVTLKSNLSVEEMAEEIAACGLAIGSLSTVSYEIATVGRPFIGVQIAENQTLMRHFFDAQGLSLATLHPDFNDEELQNALCVAQDNPAIVHRTLQWQRNVFDGKSAFRFQTLFQSLCFATV